MKNAKNFNIKLKAISTAVMSLFVINSALADEAEFKALTQPQSSVQVEAIGVDNSSAKFGEYNGLNRSGAYVNGGFSVKGGGAYKDNEQGDTTRWSATGENLGLTSRSAGAALSDQGSWNLGINYDQLQHNISNTYQTPYNGSMGGNTFTLPSNFVVPTLPGVTPAAGAAIGRNCNAQTTSTALPGGTTCLTQASGFQGMGISSTRYNTTLNGTAIVDKDLNFTFEYNNLKQTGAKLQAVAGSRTVNSNTVESISILPMPTNYTTDTLNLAVNWKGEGSHLTASYFGSFFQDGYNSFQWQPFTQNGSVAALQTMSTAPSNMLNQLNLSGGYDLAAKTKLSGNFSYGINTQNSSFAYDSAQVVQGGPSGTMPANSSMNGLVNTTHADVKVIDQSVKDLALSALAKFDQRDNLSQSNMYQFMSVGTSGAYMPNTPMSIKQMQLQLAGDYKITQAQKVNVALTNTNINRWCNQYGSQTGAVATSGTVYGQSPYPSGSMYANSPNCVSATGSQENKLEANYKIKANEELSFKLGAGYGYRHTDWDQSAVVAMPYGSPYVQSAPGLNSWNYSGFQPYFEASRKQFIGKAGTLWQATENLSVNLGGKYTSDTYPNSTYGVQNGNSWSLNLDGTYAYAEEGTINAYATQQNMQRAMVSNSSAGSWGNTLQTNGTTLGLGAKQGGLFNGKVTVGADATYSIASSIYNTQTNYSGCTTTVSGVAVANGNCGALPAIQNNLAVIKLNGSYQIDKNSKIGLAYWYQHLYSNDYYYNGTQFGAVQASTSNGMMPTGQQSPGYSVNVFSANYTYTFD